MRETDTNRSPMHLFMPQMPTKFGVVSSVNLGLQLAGRTWVPEPSLLLLAGSWTLELRPCVGDGGTT